MLSVDAVTGEIYLQLQPTSKTEDVAQYLIDLCEDAYKDNIEPIWYPGGGNIVLKCPTQAA
jgi:hypothetical protein